MGEQKPGMYIFFVRLIHIIFFGSSLFSVCRLYRPTWSLAFCCLGSSLFSVGKPGDTISSSSLCLRGEIGVHGPHHKDTKAQRKFLGRTIPTQFSEEPLPLRLFLAIAQEMNHKGTNMYLNIAE